MAVQLAKALGLYTVAVAGPANAAWVAAQLGADEVVDYSTQVRGARGAAARAQRAPGRVCARLPRPPAPLACAARLPADAGLQRGVRGQAV